jgi:hypothetical protein
MSPSQATKPIQSNPSQPKPRQATKPIQATEARPSHRAMPKPPIQSNEPHIERQCADKTGQETN